MRRRDLIEATLDAVADLGLAGATVREVAKRASVTPGLIRRYFRSKNHLIESAYATFINTMNDDVCGQVGSGPPAERMKRLVHTITTEPVASSRNLAIWAAFIGVAPVDNTMAGIHRDGYRMMRLTLEEIIRDAGQAHGLLLSDAMIKRHAIAANAVIDGIWLEVSLDQQAFQDLNIEALTLESIRSILRWPHPEGRRSAQEFC
ncbi:MAG: TetR family transcriptional regulator C-terminal domain-containing protein [Pseudomonadota bacterium]